MTKLQFVLLPLVLLATMLAAGCGQNQKQSVTITAPTPIDVKPPDPLEFFLNGGIEIIVGKNSRGLNYVKFKGYRMDALLSERVDMNGASFRIRTYKGDSNVRAVAYMAEYPNGPSPTSPGGEDGVPYVILQDVPFEGIVKFDLMVRPRGVASETLVTYPFPGSVRLSEGLRIEGQFVKGPLEAVQ